MKRTIAFQDMTVIYDFTFKRVKNINLRVRGDGSVTLSAPYGTPSAMIDAFLRSREGWIREKISAASHSAVPFTFSDGERMMLFGHSYPICVLEGKTNGIDWGKEALTFTVTDPTDRKLREALFRRWQTDLCRDTLLPICEKWREHFQARGVSYPTFTFRRMKTRWGSCHPQKGKITLNTMLVEKPMPFIEYVVVHEFAHLLHPDHSPRFYVAVAEALPDYKERRALGKNG
ncbi:MAG: M48 family metallopeptidase [Ruminococcaceae bacterium]|nr:M48 family metallopeptidase [Oscillospiraceae bacterium]